MAENLHRGNQTPTFVIAVKPERFERLIESHGTVCRIMQTRVCPCSADNGGSPNNHCLICRGEGRIYGFQRKFLRRDEDSDIDPINRDRVRPFLVPVLEPVSVERPMAEEAGGNIEYEVTGWTDREIMIAGDPLPNHWEPMRVSYWFDGYNRGTKDKVRIVNKRIIRTTQTKWENENKTGNPLDIHGHLVIVTRLWDKAKAHEFKNFTFSRNEIYLGDNEPDPTPGQTFAWYYYAPVAKCLPTNMDSTTLNTEAWQQMLREGQIQIAVPDWWQIAQGDLVTFLAVEHLRDEVIVHGPAGIDRTNEFEVTRLSETIMDAKGEMYRLGTDFTLRSYGHIIWIGRQPAPGVAFSVRISYRPTFAVYQQNPIPNAMENKALPQTFHVKYFSRKMIIPEKPVERPQVYLPGAASPKIEGLK